MMTVYLNSLQQLHLQVLQQLHLQVLQQLRQAQHLRLPHHLGAVILVQTSMTGIPLMIVFVRITTTLMDALMTQPATMTRQKVATESNPFAEIMQINQFVFALLNVPTILTKEVALKRFRGFKRFVTYQIAQPHHLHLRQHPVQQLL